MDKFLQQCCRIQVRLPLSMKILSNFLVLRSMWPLLKKDGLTLQYCILPFFTNYLMGVNPLKYRGFIKYLCIVREILCI